MRVEVLTQPERRRRWSDEEKLRILREASELGVRYADVARRHDVSPAQLYQWRVALREGRLVDPCGGMVGFVEVGPDEAVAADPAVQAAEAPPIEIALARGRVLKAPSSLGTAELVRLIRAVEGA